MARFKNTLEFVNQMNGEDFVTVLNEMEENNNSNTYYMHPNDLIDFIWDITKNKDFYDFALFFNSVDTGKVFRNYLNNHYDENDWAFIDDYNWLQLTTTDELKDLYTKDVVDAINDSEISDDTLAPIEESLGIDLK